MNDAKLEEIRDKILSVLLPVGIKRAALFGSVVREEEKSESDVDVLVEFREPIGLFALAGLRQMLSEELNCPVDLVTEGFLSRYIRPYVDQEKVILYEE